MTGAERRTGGERGQGPDPVALERELEAIVHFRRVRDEALAAVRELLGIHRPRG